MGPADIRRNIFFLRGDTDRPVVVYWNGEDDGTLGCNVRVERVPLGAPYVAVVLFDKLAIQ